MHSGSWLAFGVSAVFMGGLSAAEAQTYPGASLGGRVYSGQYTCQGLPRAVPIKVTIWPGAPGQLTGLVESGGDGSPRGSYRVAVRQLGPTSYRLDPTGWVIRPDGHVNAPIRVEVLQNQIRLVFDGPCPSTILQYASATGAGSYATATAPVQPPPPPVRPPAPKATVAAPAQKPAQAKPARRHPPEWYTGAVIANNPKTKHCLKRVKKSTDITTNYKGYYSNGGTVYNSPYTTYDRHDYEVLENTCGFNVNITMACDIGSYGRMDDEVLAPGKSRSAPSRGGWCNLIVR